MEKNALINSRLKDLLDVMDARTTVSIFLEKDGKQTRIAFCKVYRLLVETDLIKKYEVIGLNCRLTTDILVKEA
jgi:hypothetical protein